MVNSCVNFSLRQRRAARWDWCRQTRDSGTPCSPSASFRTNVTGHSGIVTDDFRGSGKSVTFNQNRRSRSVGTTGHIQIRT
jgi:hypothetical protein